MKVIVEWYDIGFVANKYSSNSIKEILENITPEDIFRKRINLLNKRKEFIAEKDWNHLIDLIDSKIKN